MSRKRTLSYQTNEGRKKKELLEEKLEDIQTILTNIQEEANTVATKQANAAILISVCSGLYTETEKLSKKNPNLPSTNLIVEQVNQVIKEIKEVADKDAYIQRLKQFVPAGDNPEIQDVVVILKQISQGLERFKSVPETLKKEVELKKSEAKLICGILNSLLEDNLEKYAGETPYGKQFQHWFGNSEFGYFEFDKLIETELFEYFNYEQQKES